MSLNPKNLPFFIAVVLALGIYIGDKVSNNASNPFVSMNNIRKQKLNRLIDYLEYEYVDPVDTDSIVETFIDEVLQNLDPHSTYIPKQDLESVTENMKGDFIGIGVSFYSLKTPLPSFVQLRVGRVFVLGFWQAIAF